MSISQINHLLTSTVPKEGFFDFRTLSHTDRKMIRSSVLAYNLTPRESNLISSYEITKVDLSSRECLKNWDFKEWYRLALIISLLSFPVIQTRNIINHGMVIYYCSETQNLATEILITFFILPLTALLLYLLHIDTKEWDRVKVTIKPYERAVPNRIANRVTEEGDLEDPITREPMSPNRIQSPQFIYLKNCIVEITNCMRSILGRPIIGENDAFTRFAHPLEGYQLSEDDSNDLEESLIRVFGAEAAAIAKPSSATPDEKIREFLGLYDKSIRPLLVGFESDNKLI